MRHRFRVHSSQPPSINNNPSIARMHQAAGAPNSSQTDNSICSPRWRWAKVSWWAHRRWPWWLLDENQVRRCLRRSTRVRQGGWSAAVLTLRQFTPRQAKGAGCGYRSRPVLMCGALAPLTSPFTARAGRCTTFAGACNPSCLCWRQIT